MVRLEVEAGSPATEIFVSDSKFRRIGRGVDSLSLDVAPGFYKVRFRVGPNQQDKLVEVPASEGVIHVKGDPVAYDSAVPWGRPGVPHDDALAAARASKKVHERLGAGSRLLVVVRSPDETEVAACEGVSLRHLDGRELLPLAEGELSRGGAFAAVNAEVDPGTYRLRVETGELGTYEMFLVASPGWQTQAFAVTDDFVAGRNRVRRAALRSTSVLMARTEVGFDPKRKDLRLADLARTALGARRQVAHDSDQEALEYGKFENPMLGIYGAHLLLLAHRPHHELIDLMTENLRGLVGLTEPDDPASGHPDVEALSIRPKSKTSLPRTARFRTPPMLRSSWELIVRASQRRHSIVPAGSAADLVADNVVDSGPWLLHRVPSSEVATADETEVSFAEAQRMLSRLVKTHSGARDLKKSLRTMASDAESLTVLETKLLKSVLTLQWLEDAEAESEPPTYPPEHPAMTRVIRRLGAPATSVARSAKSLVKKLGAG